MTFGGTAATNVAVTNATTITAISTCRNCRCSDRDSNGQRPERKFGEWIYLCSDTDGDQRFAE